MKLPFSSSHYYRRFKKKSQSFDIPFFVCVCVDEWSKVMKDLLSLIRKLPYNFINEHIFLSLSSFIYLTAFVR